MGIVIRKTCLAIILQIAEYHFKSGHKPVHSDGSEAEIADGTKVLVIRTTGTYGRKGPDRSINQVEAYVFKQWKNGYGGVSIFFNTGDLTILY